MTETFWLLAFLGRVHPLVVHFPIGLLVTAWVIEAVGMARGSTSAAPTVDLLTRVGAWTAVPTVVFGLLLFRDGAYEGLVPTLHLWGGFVTAILAFASVLALRRSPAIGGGRRLVFRLLLTATLLALTGTGHLGASLTHGENYLTEVLPWAEGGAEVDQKGIALALASLEGVEEPTLNDMNRLLLQVRSIFAHSCYRCHSRNEREGGLVLQTREGVLAGGDSGPVIVAGDADASELVRRLELPKGHEDAMPSKGRALTAQEIRAIRRWIDLGAHWPEGEVKVFREAPLALVRPPLPDAGNVEHPIDRFVDAYFEANDRAWPDPVDDHTFLRRVFLDVVGLLPEPDDVERFVSDRSPVKRERLVDELLARRHDYAQHWLTFWNDLLRNDYSGTGYITGGRRPVTNWLYDALLHNRSYVAMVEDLLLPADEASGFVQGIRWRGAVNSSQTVEMQAAQNISQVMLGLNLKCASCHDSFVSNLTLDQAYGFAGIFADSTLEIHRCDKPTGRAVDPAFLFTDLGSIDPVAPREVRMRQLAELVTSHENGRLYRTMVNRYWALLLGRGLVEPVDEMDNLPWSQNLLDWLAAEFRETHGDLQGLLRLILTSRTYQLPSVGVPDDAALRSDAFTFRGPVTRRLTAEQFADAVSRLAAPLYPAVAFDPVGAGLDADWVWFDAEENDRDALPAPGRYYLRRTFDLPTGLAPASSSLLVTADHAFELYLNEQRVGEGANWHTVYRFSVDDLVRPGRNVLAVAGENEGPLPNPAGLLLNLRIVTERGDTLSVASDARWKAVDTEPASTWTGTDFDDTEWRDVRRFGSHGRNRHWGRLLAFRHDDDGRELDLARASLVYNDEFLKALGRPVRDNVNTFREGHATLLQSLALSNGEFLAGVLARGAERRLGADRGDRDAERLVEEIYREALGRAPQRDELRAVVGRIGDGSSAENVEDLLWAVIMLPEFQLIR